MSAANNSTGVPSELNCWAEEVRTSGLHLESAMVSVIGLAYKLEHLRANPPSDKRDKQAFRTWSKKQRAARRSMRQALSALEGAFKKEYASETEPNQLTWSGARPEDSICS